MIKAVIFNIGGVLAHDVWEHLFFDEDGICNKFNLPREKLETVGRKLYEEYAYRQIPEASDWRSLEKEYWKKFINEFRAELPQSITDDDLIQLSESSIREVSSDEMVSLLKELRLNNLILAICSNNTPFWFARQKSESKLTDFFSDENIVLSYQVGAPKSHSNCAMFNAVSERVGVDKEETIFIDDRQGNISQAERCGIKGILFETYSPDNIKALKNALRELGISLR
ncbi:MAG: HAD-IA family hydrolase [bacterium]|nr:HAD-IA family hydrolase [bacterium]